MFESHASSEEMCRVSRDRWLCLLRPAGAFGIHRGREPAASFFAQRSPISFIVCVEGGPGSRDGVLIVCWQMNTWFGWRQASLHMLSVANDGRQINRRRSGSPARSTMMCASLWQGAAGVTDGLALALAPIFA